MLQTVRVRDVLVPLDDWGKSEIPDKTCVFEDDTLGRALGVLDAEQADGAAVRQRTGEQASSAGSPRPTPRPPMPAVSAEISEEEHR